MNHNKIDPETLARCIEIVESEEELDGPMPEENRKLAEQVGIEESMRSTVRGTKKSILRKLRALTPEPGPGDISVTGVAQRESYDCMRACVATIFGLRYEGVPDFPADRDESKLTNGLTLGWLQERELGEWLRRRGLGFIRLPDPDKALARGANSARPPWGICIGIGKSPRGNHKHAVVFDARSEREVRPVMLHDPHPDGSGLEGGPDDFICLTVFEPHRVNNPGEEVAATAKSVESTEERRASDCGDEPSAVPSDQPASPLPSAEEFGKRVAESVWGAESLISHYDTEDFNNLAQNAADLVRARDEAVRKGAEEIRDEALIGFDEARRENAALRDRLAEEKKGDDLFAQLQRCREVVEAARRKNEELESELKQCHEALEKAAKYAGAFEDDSVPFDKYIDIREDFMNAVARYAKDPS